MAHCYMSGRRIADAAKMYGELYDLVDTQVDEAELATNYGGYDLVPTKEERGLLTPSSPTKRAVLMLCLAIWKGRQRGTRTRQSSLDTPIAQFRITRKSRPNG